MIAIRLRWRRTIIDLIDIIIKITDLIDIIITIISPVMVFILGLMLLEVTILEICSSKH